MKTKINNLEQKNIILEIMNFIDKICNENNITYSVIAGTMLGAIRHKGFIPWDDDLDIILKREDYERLKILLIRETQGTNFTVRVPETVPLGYFNLPFIKVMDKRTYARTVEERGKNYGVFVDIFPMDRVPIDKIDFFSKSCQKKLQLLNLSGFPSYCISDKKIKIVIKSIFMFPKFIETRIRVKKSLREQRNDLLKFMQSFNSISEDFVYMYGCEQYPNIVFLPEWLEKTKRVPFENLSVPVYTEYDKILKMYYGDYMTPPDPIPETIHGYNFYWKD